MGIKWCIKDLSSMLGHRRKYKLFKAPGSGGSLHSLGSHVSLSTVAASSKGSQVSVEREVEVVRRSPAPFSLTAGRATHISAPQILRYWLNLCPTPEICISLLKQLVLLYLCKIGCCQYQRAAAQLRAGEVEEDQEALPVLVLSHNSPKPARGQGRSVKEPGGLKACWKEFSCPWGKILHLRKDPALCFLES